MLCYIYFIICFEVPNVIALLNENDIINKLPTITNIGEVILEISSELMLQKK